MSTRKSASDTAREPTKAKVQSLTRRKKEGAVVQSIRPSVRQYVLDTNVLLHDPMAIFRFKEHNVVVPMAVLEELDRHKKGVADLARNARQVTRTLDELLSEGSLTEGFALKHASGEQATGRLFFREAGDLSVVVPSTDLQADKADNKILGCAMALLKQGHAAVLVTKDINLRVKALASDVPAQDYRNDRVLSDEDVLPSGFLRIDGDFWEQHGAVNEAAFWQSRGATYARVHLTLPLNSFLIEAMPSGRARLWRVIRRDLKGVILESIARHVECGGVDALLQPRNDEQALALNLLHDEDVDFTALLGPAGTGKTLLAIAAGLEQVKAGRYQEVMVTRATVPLGEEIGFLPGTEQDKMSAWLGGTLRDVYAVLGLENEQHPLRTKVEIASMSFMRGRSFQGKYIVIDEAQNLTSLQIRALLTRAGDGSKVVLTGNVSQIDTPYLDAGSSGLAWAVKNLQDWSHAGHLILTQGERSRLASYVEAMAGQTIT